jgi:hypothetical protein
MEALAPIPFPPAADAADDAALNEVDVAIALVSAGAAVRVRVAGIAAPMADRLREVAGRPKLRGSGAVPGGGWP